MSNEQISFGERIKRARERAGMNADELASILGVSETTVIRWETSEQQLPDVITRKIVGALNISVSYLTGDSETPEYKPTPSATQPSVQVRQERRRRERLWQRDLPSQYGDTGPFAFTCLEKCRELRAALLAEGGIATAEDLRSLARDLERTREAVEKLIQEKS